MEDLDNITDEYDREFISLMITIEKKSEILNKYDKLRIKNWCKKLCQVTNNIEWKKNRNLHAICLMDMILNNRFEEPYNKFAPDGPIPILSKTLVKSRLSNKFWKCTQKLYEQINNQENEDNYIEENNDNNFENEEQNERLKGLNKNINKNTNNFNNERNYEIKNNKQDNSEIENMKMIISKLQNDLNKKDLIIQNQKEEKVKLEKRIDELEKMLSSFLAMDKGQ